MKSSSDTRETFYISLREEVEETFGKKIDSARQCLLLSEEVFFKNSVNIIQTHSGGFLD
jgi:hypothetical protein